MLNQGLYRYRDAAFLHSDYRSPPAISSGERAAVRDGDAATYAADCIR